MHFEDKLRVQRGKMLFRRQKDQETIRLMKKIDEVIDEHGGWPGAFVSSQQAASQES